MNDMVGIAIAEFESLIERNITGKESQQQQEIVCGILIYTLGLIAAAMGKDHRAIANWEVGLLLDRVVDLIDKMELKEVQNK